MHKVMLLITAIFLFFSGCSTGCSKKVGMAPTDDNEAMSFLVAPPPPSATRATEADRLSTESKIIKTASLEFQVDDIEESKKRISRLVEEENGYITNLEETGNRTRVQSSFTIRVPAAGFDSLVERILKEGVHVGNVRIERKDVTEEFLDLNARMETQKALEIRYREILRQAGNVEEILKVEQALGALREEIEAKEGRIRYLSHQAEYSTIHARAYQNLPYSPPPPGVRQSFIGRLTSSLVNGWTGLVDFIFDLLSIWPLVIVFCGIVYSIRKLIRRRRQGAASSKGTATPSRP